MRTGDGMESRWWRDSGEPAALGISRRQAIEGARRRPQWGAGNAMKWRRDDLGSSGNELRLTNA
ncbi:uncharacterized protein N7469_007937 [Penicillium citrinum]|uniref:Uncharacterized protein n=2 Tax=Penicillium TaxID=5073 RepID=A0A9W9TJ45_PENCI|nr:uncharacterized protein N7469_007937 [Penicillium citrinum]KAJ5224434.1 hypothetical protein N7469_007937 [Penicillium citrinum]KAJ5574686.1 hypothetical protein N7450_008585 [Penicillium hetheringtonii]